MTMSNRIAVMDAGELQQFADPLTCYNRPANRFVAGFIGSPSMNFFDAETTEEGISTPYFSVPMDHDGLRTRPGQSVTFGVRPEAVMVADGPPETDGLTEPIRATIDVVEPVGDEVFVYLLLEESAREGLSVEEDTDLLMSVPPDPSLTDEAEGREIEVRLDRRRIHLFDGETGDALAHGLEGAESQQPVAREAESD